jgi:tetratricopeptide (TPR) repeat protein
MGGTLQPESPAKVRRWQAILVAGRKGYAALQRELVLKYLQQHPDDVWAWVLLARTLTGLEQLAQAQAVLRQAGKLASGEALGELWLQWGQLSEAQGSAARALRWYRKALGVQLTSRGLLLLGSALVRRGEWAEAKACYQRLARRAEPGREEAYCQLGLLQRAEGKYRAALRSLDAALAIDAQLPAALDARQDVLAALQGTKSKRPLAAEQGRARLLTAKQEGRSAVQRDLGSSYVMAHPRDFRGWLLLADALAALHRYVDAGAAWRRALRLAPQPARAQIEVFWGQMCQEQGAREHAIRHYRKALALEVTGPWLTLLGAALAQRGQFAEARRCLIRAIARADEGTEEAHCQLGLVYRAERDYAAALASLEDALALDPRYPPARLAHQDVRRALQAHPPPR